MQKKKKNMSYSRMTIKQLLFYSFEFKDIERH